MGFVRSASDEARRSSALLHVRHHAASHSFWFRFVKKNTYIYINTHTHTHTHTHIYIYTFKQYIQISIYICAYTHTHTHTHIYIYMYTQAYIPIHIYIYIYIIYLDFIMSLFLCLKLIDTQTTWDRKMQFCPKDHVSIYMVLIVSKIPLIL